MRHFLAARHLDDSKAKYHPAAESSSAIAQKYPTLILTRAIVGLANG
jgi:hypothetical protein